jgi:hypothetical protein
MVVEVEYRQRLKDGLRHAAPKGLGPDKKPELIRRSPLSDRGPVLIAESSDHEGNDPNSSKKHGRRIA